MKGQQVVLSQGIGPEALKSSLLAIAEKQQNTEDPFYLIDVGDVYRKFRQWERMLPRIEPFYAVKCNPDPTILQSMVSLDMSYDCASKSEIETMLALGVNPEKIVYANPCKQVSHLKYAIQQGVTMMTFDNVHELEKCKLHAPNAKLLLRVLADDSRSICKLGLKYGAHPGCTAKLLRQARDLGLNVVGVSFHVGSGCLDASAFSDAVVVARKVFDEGEDLGFKFNLLDVGGGFPGTDVGAVSFKEIVTELNAALDKHFPASSGVRIIAEPGRYFVASACTIAVNVIAKREVEEVDYPSTPVHSPSIVEETPKTMYYVNDGLYGSFNCCLFDHAVVEAKHFKKAKVQTEVSSVWGPTCDSIDCILKQTKLPCLEVGDWLYFEDMGAYTMCAASTFNGFKEPHRFYIFSTTEWFDITELPTDFPLAAHI
eukprot:m.86559 g.86559  ORF g.86559 m.86559 type:complete len:428 (-) comp21343_c0_seq1:73-1356(-)